jgi:hypothetical protein
MTQRPYKTNVGVLKTIVPSEILSNLVFNFIFKPEKDTHEILSNKEELRTDETPRRSLP